MKAVTPSHVTVPVEATEEMVNAVIEWIDDEEGPHIFFRNVWRAMCAAAPAPEPSPEPGWQDISTAPKDGTRILAYQPGHLHMIAVWAGYADYGGPRWYSTSNPGRMNDINPTHWMPLPDFSMTSEQMLKHIANRCRTYPTQKEFAASLGVSAQYLHDVLIGRRDISAALAAKLGYRREVVFLPAPPKETKT